MFSKLETKGKIVQMGENFHIHVSLYAEIGKTLQVLFPIQSYASIIPLNNA